LYFGLPANQPVSLLAIYPSIQPVSLPASQTAIHPSIQLACQPSNQPTPSPLCNFLNPDYNSFSSVLNMIAMRTEFSPHKVLQHTIHVIVSRDSLGRRKGEAKANTEMTVPNIPWPRATIIATLSTNMVITIDK
jgi:hypothetical protein